MYGNATDNVMSVQRVCSLALSPGIFSMSTMLSRDRCDDSISLQKVCSDITLTYVLALASMKNKPAKKGQDGGL